MVKININDYYDSLSDSLNEQNQKERLLYQENRRRKRQRR